MPLGRTIFEPPPPEWDSGPFPKGEPHVVYFDDMDKLNTWCRSWGIEPQGKVQRMNGCYAVQFNMIGAPDPKTWPGGQREVDQIIRHEKGHARGGLHGKTQRDDWVAADWYVEMVREQAATNPLEAAMKNLAGSQ